MTHSVKAHADAELHRHAGLTSARIQSLSDNIFAFAMTLLVLNFLTPALAAGEPLPEILRTLIPDFLTYAMSFVILGLMWVSQQNQYQFIDRSDRLFLWINILFLMFVVFVPFSTHVLALYWDSHLALLLYGGNLLVCGLLLYAHWSYATQGSRLVTNDLSERAILLIKTRLLFLIALVTAALVFSSVSTAFTFALFGAAMVLAIVPTIIDRVTHWWLT